VGPLSSEALTTLPTWHTHTPTTAHTSVPYTPPHLDPHETMGPTAPRTRTHRTFHSWDCWCESWNSGGSVWDQHPPDWSWVSGQSVGGGVHNAYRPRSGVAGFSAWFLPLAYRYALSARATTATMPITRTLRALTCLPSACPAASHRLPPLAPMVCQINYRPSDGRSHSSVQNQLIRGGLDSRGQLGQVGRM